MVENHIMVNRYNNSDTLEKLRHQISNRNLDTQIFLVGNNPLPVYVAAKVLNPKYFIFVHTEQTKYFAKRLYHLLGVQKEYFIEVEPSNVKKIGDKISCYLRKNQFHTNIGLHYSGGTKAMTVAASQYLIKNHYVKQENASYLDPRKLSLIFTDNAYIPIKQGLKLQFDELSSLHGLEIASNEQKLSSQERFEIAKRIFVKGGNTRKENRKFRYDFKRIIPKKDIQLNKKGMETFKQKWKNLVGNDLPDSIDNSCLGELCLLISGNWLEELVKYCLIKTNMANPGAKNIRSNLRCQINPNKTNNTDEIIKTTGFFGEYELDVCMMRGYQFYAFSCTTGGHKACKPRLFEVVYRAAQLGGDEARAALVTLLTNDQARNLQKSIARQFSAIDGSFFKNRVAVFSFEDLQNWMSDRNHDLIQWIKMET